MLRRKHEPEIVYIPVKTKEERLALMFQEIGTEYPVEYVLDKTSIKSIASLKTTMWRLRPGIDLHLLWGYVRRTA